MDGFLAPSAMIDSTPLPMRVRDLAAEEPNRTILVDIDNDRVVSRREFDEEVDRWARALSAVEVGPGHTVVTMQPTSAEALAVWIGLGRLTAIEVPLNTQLRAHLLSYVLKDTGARVAIVHSRFLDQVLEVLPDCPGIEHVIVTGDERLIDDSRISQGVDFLHRGADSDLEGLAPPRLSNTAAIVYTSGTTGRSKGVIVPWAQLQTTASWSPTPAAGLGSDDIAYVPFPIFHISVRSPVATMIMHGGVAVIRERFSTATFWDDVRRHGCTYGQLLAGMTHLLLALPPSETDADNPLRVLNIVPMASSYREIEERFGVRLGTIFTMTEISVPFATIDWRVEDPSSCGRLRPGCEARLVDDDDREVGDGEPGELIVRTSEPWTLMAGYWNKDAETARAWRNGWFHTGDVFRRDERGLYFFVDRKKDSIRRRGENISSLELESLIVRHPAVLEAAVVGVASPDADLGFTDESVRAFIVLGEGEDVHPRDLRRDLEAHVPRFMLPRYIDIVSELPHTPTFKVRKVDLRAEPISADTWDAEASR